MKPSLLINNTSFHQDLLPWDLALANATSTATGSAWTIVKKIGENTVTTQLKGTDLKYDLYGNLIGGTVSEIAVSVKEPGEVIGDLIYQIGDGFSFNWANYNPETGLQGILNHTLNQGANILVPVGADGTTAVLHGYAGNDLFLASGLDLESAVIDGGAGIDVLGYVGVGSLSSLQQTDFGWTLQDGDIQYGLASVERVHGLDPFNSTVNDLSRALDLDGNAGQAARLMGTLLGKPALQNEALVGEVLSYVDTYGLSTVTQVLETNGIIDAIVGGSDTSAFFRTVYKNVIGAEPSQVELAELASYVDSGAYTKAQALEVVANLDQTAAAIDLVGLSQTGLEFTPFG